MTTQKTIKSQAEVITVCQSRIKGITTHVPKTGTIACSGKAYTPDELVATYQECIETRLALEALRHQEEVALKAREDADAARKVVDPALIRWAVDTFGPESQQAKDLGYLPRNPTPPTTEVKAAASAKARATRAAHGGARKKAAKAAPEVTAAAETATPGTPVTTKG